MKLRRPLNHGSKVWLLLAAAPVAAAEPQPASQPAPLIADVVITAERRLDTVQAVPIAVTALPAAALSARNLDTPLLIANAVPNMFASNAVGLGSANTYTLRGLGQDLTPATFSPAVATFIDDIYFGRTNGSNFRLFDIERAEVLRGSQGTLHGRNTIGGAIRIVNNRPSDTLGGFGEIAYGAFDRVLLRGSFDMPVNKTVQVKLSGYYLNDDGYVQNTTTGETLNDSDAAGLRGAVQLQFTDTLRWNGAATYMRNDGENLPNLLCDPNAPTVCDGRYSGTSARKDPLPVAGNANPPRALGNRLDTQLYTSHFEWVGDDFALSAITGFVNTRERAALDLSPGLSRSTESPYPPVNAAAFIGASLAINDGSSDQFSQELKVAASLLAGRVDVVAGLLYTDEDNVSDTGDVTVRNGTIDKAAYLQVDVNATPRLKITGGVRYTDEQTRFDISDNRSSVFSSCLTFSPRCRDTANLVTGTARTPIPTSTTTKIWTPRFAISYRAADAVLLHASAARGWRSGGWDARSRSVNYVRPFAAETGWTYEGGIKADAFDGRLRANLVGFWIEAQNSQALRMASSRDFFSGESVQNIDGFRDRGLELELQAVPVKGLMLSASLGYQQARHVVSESLAPNEFGLKAVAQQQLDCRAQLAKRLVPFSSGRVLIGGQALPPVVIASQTNAVDCANGIVDANGDIATPPRAPDFSLAFGGSYDWPIPAAGIILTPSVNAVYRSAFEADAANATLFTGSVTGVFNRVMPANPFAGEIIAGSRQPAVWQVAAALTLRTDDNNWTLALECENCLDTAFVQTSVDLVNFYNPPRVWQIRARRAF